MTMIQHLTPSLLFKCLADDTRGHLTLLIAREGELCVCELTAALQVSQPKVSRHLALLRSSGLLVDRRQGQWVYYQLHPHLPDWVRDTLNAVLAGNRHWLGEALGRLQALRDASACGSACD